MMEVLRAELREAQKGRRRAEEETKQCFTLVQVCTACTRAECNAHN